MKKTLLIFATTLTLLSSCQKKEIESPKYIYSSNCFSENVIISNVKTNESLDIQINGNIYYLKYVSNLTYSNENYSVQMKNSNWVKMDDLILIDKNNNVCQLIKENKKLSLN